MKECPLQLKRAQHVGTGPHFAVLPTHGALCNPLIYCFASELFLAVFNYFFYS